MSRQEQIVVGEIKTNATIRLQLLVRATLPDYYSAGKPRGD